MRRENVYWDFDALMKMGFFEKAAQKARAKKEQVLKSMKIEDEIYKEPRRKSPLLDEIEQNCKQKLSTIENLSRDVFQSFYSLNVRHNPDDELSPLVRKFNRHILDEMMKLPEYPAIKSISEGKQFPAFEAAEQFMEHVADNLDTMMDAANGGKNLLEALQRQGQKQSILSDKLSEQIAQNAPNEKLLQTANRLKSVVGQVETLDKMVSDNLLKDKDVSNIIQAATQKAKETAEEIQAVIRAWGSEDADMQESTLNKELLSKVRNNKSLLDIAKYLGRFRELLRQKRLNGFAFGRGEKYSIEMGSRLSLLLSSEFGLLATAEAVPLFLRKYQRKALKQYAKRERICKGQGDIIVCLDESSSTRGDNAAWGKAVAFAMLDVAGIHGRNFALIHFANNTSIQTDLFLKNQYTQQDVMQSANKFLGGGTNFEMPMTKAIGLIESGNFSNADIVFITDGECSMSDDFTTQLKEKQVANGFTVTGILMDQNDAGMEFSLTPFCNVIYRISELGGDRIVDALLSDRAA